VSRHRRTQQLVRQAPFQQLIAQIFRFGVVGTVGFAVDGGLLTLLAQLAGWDVYVARAASFSSATLVTWALNRVVTFRMPRGHRTNNKAKEYGAYFLIQSGGALINLTIFAALLWRYPQLEQLPMVPLAAGSAVALFFNFFAARRFVYRTRSIP